MEGIEHKMVRVNGLDMHVAEKGQGPLVLFLHGFPELWPDRVKALVNLSVMYMPRDPTRSLAQTFRDLYGDDHYISRFQEPGDIEAELAPLEEDVDYFTSKFEKTGFTGGVNYYRALDLSWELTAPWTGAKVTVPTKFVVGDLDLTYHITGAQEYIHNGAFHKDVPLLEEVVVMEGVAHFINQEKPDEISKHIHDFLKKF
ncbi:hypothetical protein RJ639_005725 [Escallonia herrerae]|uniref:Epoxide hydrolase n=1 Tax=Escallonia herrerae TaxID=1293975 RepID=A0AA88VVL4_9ASTE|nr:hypothetical protein RJ639_005725 [Escallonia herrerae]